MQIDVGIICVLTDCELPAVLRAFGIPLDDIANETVDGTRYWFANVDSRVKRSTLRVVITAIGESGNPTASAATTSLIERYHPALVCLVGIAAGVQAQVALGDIVIASSVLGYEKEKLLPGYDDDLRPAHKEPLFATRADLQHFTGRFPHDRLKAEVESQLATLQASALPARHVIPTQVQVFSKTIASGEKIFGDGSLATLANIYHDKRIVAGEMEGIGFALAAERKHCAWLVIRGISDFGDPQSKDGRLKDRFHNYASIVAAVAVRLFLELQYTGPPSHAATVFKRTGAHAGVLVTAVLLIASSGAWLWDYNRVKVRHFANIGTRWGVPEGVSPLSAETWRRRETHFRLEFHRNKLRRALRVNSQGHLADDDESEFPASQEVFYREDGIVQQITVRDAKRNLIMRQTYGEQQQAETGVVQYVDFRAEHRDEPYALSSSVGSLGVSDSRFLATASEITAHQFIYDGSGRISRVLFLNAHRQNRPNAEGAFGHSLTYDGESVLPARVDLLGPHETPAPGWIGRHRMTIGRDKLGDINERRYFGIDGSPVIGTPGCHQEMSRRDSYGNRIEFSCFGVDSEPASYSHGYHRSTQRFDQAGNVIYWAHYGVDGKPALDRDGVHACKRRFDPLGFVIEWAYYGTDGAPTLHNDGYHKGKQEVDADGNVTESSSWGTDDRPTVDNAGVHSTRFRYDRRGNIVEAATFGIDGKPSSRPPGFHVVRSRYDPHDRLVRQAFFGTDGKPTSNEEGVHCYTMVRDINGNVIEQSLFGAGGEPVVSEHGYHRFTESFDAGGNPIELAYFGVDGRPLEIEGYHRSTYSFDLRANTSDVKFFGVDGAPSVNADGVHRAAFRFDVRGNLIEEAYFDSGGGPARSSAGYHKRRCIVDQRGFASECAYFAADDSPAADRDGIHRVLRARLDRHGMSSDETYWGIDGRPARDSSGVHRRTGSFDYKGDVVEFATFKPNEEKPTLAMSVVESALGSLLDNEVDFTQRFTPKGFRSATIESGTAIFGPPPLMRWRYVKPERKLFIFNGDTAWLHIDETRELTTTKVSKALRESLPLLFLTDSAWLDANYTMSESKSGIEHIVRLIAKSATVSIAELTVTRSVDDGRLRRVAYTDRDGNVMVLEFSGYRKAVIAARLFAF